MSVNTIPTCGTGCDTPIKEVSFSNCNASFLEAEVVKVYIGNDGYPLNDFTDLNEWTSRISNTDAALNKIRELTVKGSLPKPEQSETKRSNNRIKYGLKQYQLPFIVDDNNDTNYEFMRSTGCNRSYRFWFETAGGKLYGGNAGILAVLNGNEDIGDDRDTDALLDFLFKWQSKFAPQRTDSPMASAA